jgi:Tfp pilus assembly protein PilV
MNQQVRSRRKDAGFTIFEVAVATAVLAMAIGTALMVMGRAFAPIDSARCISYAAQIMQSEMEKMRLTQWGNGTAAGNGTTGITAYPTTPTTVVIDSSFSSAGDIGSRMTMTRTAANAPGHTTGMIKITLTITWTSYDRRTMSRSYITYYGQNGLYDFFAA